MAQSMSSTSDAPDPVKNRMQFNKLMKEVDTLVRQERYPEAAQLLYEAKKLEPGNLYVRAFEDRIISLEKNPKNVKPVAPSPDQSQAAVEETRTRELQKYEQQRTLLIEELEAEREKLRGERESMRAQGAEEIRRSRQELQAEMDKRLAERLEKLERDYARKIDLLGISAPKTYEERLVLYRARLKKSYANGEPALEQARELIDLKDLLELSYEDHMKLDTEVRIEQYVEVVEKGLKDGLLSLDNADILEELKQKFHILPEENARIETFILSKIRQHSAPGLILIADDEEDIRVSIAYALQGHGYSVIDCSSVEEALRTLETEHVDLIVSDIKFSPGETDGFQFFQTVQRSEEWNSIPFILLSSLKDSVVVRAGLQLGVDDYLTKPIDIDLLIAVIDGKLKRKRRG